MLDSLRGTDDCQNHGRVRDANQSRRLLALAPILDGVSRSDAARNGGLRDLGCITQKGADGVLDRTKGGRKPLLSEDQLVEFDWIVETKRLV